MIVGHLDFIEKYTYHCKNGQNANSAIIKINIVMRLKSLSYIFFKVGANKVPLEKCNKLTFLRKIKILRALYFLQLLKIYKIGSLKALQC